MEHTIYLDFEEDNVPIDVYSVKLASADPSDAYGILDMTTQTSIVPYGTTVSSNPTGTYPYTFTVENGHSYFISWEIIANAGETATYRDNQVGPFFSVNNSDVRAVTTKERDFVQGSTATLLLKVTNFNGLAEDAESISIAIYNKLGLEVILETSVPEHVTTGFYVYDWEIDEEQIVGEYTVVWSYVSDDIEKAEVQKIVVSDDDSTTLMYSGRTLDFRITLNYYLSCAQSIPVYYEQAKPSRDNKIFRFSFKNWNQSSNVKIYRNGNVINEGVEVDFFKGSITFDEALSDQETVNADYNFMWFKDEELNWFLNGALQSVNIYPPHSVYTLDNVPDRYIPAILYGASKDALRQLMMCVQFQQPAQVFGGPEQAQNAFKAFDTLKQNYEKDFDKLVEQKKLGPYPSTHTIITPSYTLPGGRSRWFRMLFKS